MGQGEFGLEPDGLAALSDGLLELPLVEQGTAKVRVGHGEIGLQPDRLAARGDGLVELAFAVQASAEAAVGSGQLGVEPDRLPVCGDSLRKLALTRERVAKVGVGFGVAGLEPDGLAELSLCGRVVSFHVAQQGAETVVRVAVAGLDPDRLAKFGDGCVEFALAPQGDAEVYMGVGEIGHELDGLAEQSLGGQVVTLRVKEDAAEIDAGFGVVRLLPDGLAV